MAKNSKWKEGLSPERELVLCCARPNLDEATAGRIRNILLGPLNWPEVMAIAFEHHVETFVYENLKLVGEGHVPAARLDNLHESARKAAALAILLSSELLRIHEIFERHGVPLIPYKGPVLSCLAFGIPTRRRFDDLDFFVPHEEIARASALLESAGFVSKFKISNVLTRRSANVPGQYAFFREATRAQVELHTERS